MSLLTVERTVDHGAARFPGCWKVLSDGSHVYLFRALDLTGKGATRVYANRYVLIREPSPDGGTGKGDDLLLVKTTDSWTLDAEGIIDEVLRLRLEQDITAEDKAAARSWADAVRTKPDGSGVSVSGTNSAPA
jgi:hypothetical protein